MRGTGLGSMWGEVRVGLSWGMGLAVRWGLAGVWQRGEIWLGSGR